MASNSTTIPPPLHCGKRLLHNVIDERAAGRHERPFASIPRSQKVEDGYIDISYTAFANAINRLARWIIQELGPPTRDCEPIVYIATLDLRYQILMMAAVKAGYITCLLSPRNSRHAFSALLEECSPRLLLTSDPPSPAVSILRDLRPMQLFTIPPLAELLDANPVPQIHIDATWEQWRFRPFVQIHSSGSTGTPKLVTLKHGSFTALDGFQYLQDNELAERFGNMRVFVFIPPFHVAGITYTLASPLWVNSTVVLPPPLPLTAELVNTAHVKAGVECTLLPPSTVVELSKDPEYFKNMIKLDRLVYTGGPLPEATGKQLAPHIRLYAGYGATEWNAVPQLIRDREDWAYISFNEREGGLEFREKNPGLYEMVICRNKEKELAQPVFVTFPEIDEFESKDLFSKHPDKPGLWKYTSRLDDIIVFSNGEKLNPVTFEGLVSTSGDVKGCVVIGQGRFQPSLLVEPAHSSETENDLVAKIWPYVEKANELTVRHGRVARDCIFFTSSDKPLPRAGKGTIQRAAANQLYSSEIDSLYSKLIGDSTTDTKLPQQMDIVIDPDDFERTLASLRHFILDVIGLEKAKDSDDFFALGMDSLQVVNCVRAINVARPDEPVDVKQIYDHPSIIQLARYLHTQQVRRNDEDSDDEDLKESWLAMEEIFRELSGADMTAARSKHPWKRRLNGWIKPQGNTGPVFPPDGGRTAWLQVVAMFLVNMNNFGLTNSFGVFQAYYEKTLLPNYSPSSISIIGTLQGALLLIVGVVSGPLFDKGYFKPTLITASVGLVFALMMLSLSTKYYQVFLTQGILLGICSGLLYIPSIALVPVYFKRHRGLALGLATGGGSVGGVLYPIIFRNALKIGFGWAVRILGFIALFTLGTALVLSKPIGARIRRNLIDRGAFHERAYVIFLVSAFFIFAGFFVPYFLAAAYSRQHLRTGTGQSFYLVSIINAAQFFGRLLPAWFADHRHRILGPETVMFWAEIFMCVLGFAWIGVHNFGDFVPWAIFYGFFSGIPATLPAVVLAHICPNLAVYGTRAGILYGIAGVGVFIGAPIAGALNTRAGSFLGAQLWTGACMLVGGALFFVTAIEIRERRTRYEIGKRRRKGPRSKKMRLRLFHWNVALDINED